MLHLNRHLLHLTLCLIGCVKSKLIQFRIQFSSQQLSCTELRKEQEEMPLQTCTLHRHRALISNSWADFFLVCAYVLFPLLIPFFSALVFLSKTRGYKSAEFLWEGYSFISIACYTSTGLYVIYEGGGWGIESKVQTGLEHQKRNASTWSICRMTRKCPSKKVTCLRVETLMLIGWSPVRRRNLGLEFSL